MNNKTSFHVAFNKEAFDKEVTKILEDYKAKIVAQVYKHTSIKPRIDYDEF